MIKPLALKRGDKIATLSPSSGIAGEPSIIWRYELGARRLMDVFGFQVVSMPNSLKGIEFNDKHPEARADDLAQAFSDKSVNGIICNIGGEDSIRMLPYLDLSVIRDNPKVLSGFSDATTVHMMLRKAGLTSFYGPAVLTDFAENSGMFSYTSEYFERAVMRREPIGEVTPAGYWTSEFLDWNDMQLNSRPRNVNRSGRFRLISGQGIAEGPLLGGCLSVLHRIRDTSLFPRMQDWDGALVFLETSEVTPPPTLFEEYVRGLMEKGALVGASALVFAMPYGNTYAVEYHEILIRLLAQEAGRKDMPILTGLPFGHTSPMITIPIGVTGRVDAEAMSFSITEPGVV